MAEPRSASDCRYFDRGGSLVECGGDAYRLRPEDGADARQESCLEWPFPPIRSDRIGTHVLGCNAYSKEPRRLAGETRLI